MTEVTDRAMTRAEGHMLWIAADNPTPGACSAVARIEVPEAENDRLRAELAEVLRLVKLAHYELAALTSDPSDPNFDEACPNLADSACINKAYINLSAAIAAAEIGK